MQIKIELPEELIARIKTFLANLDDATQRSPENQGALTDEISSLNADATSLRNEISHLQRNAFGSDAAAADLNTKETRLRQVSQRLESLRMELAAVRPVKLYGTASIIQDVVGFYLQSLPDAIANYIQPLFPTRHKALHFVKFTEAHMALGQIRSWAESINSEDASANNVDMVKGVLNRALRGQAHLGTDEPHAEPVQ